MASETPEKLQTPQGEAEESPSSPEKRAGEERELSGEEIKKIIEGFDKETEELEDTLKRLKGELEKLKNEEKPEETEKGEEYDPTQIQIVGDRNIKMIIIEKKIKEIEDDLEKRKPSEKEEKIQERINDVESQLDQVEERLDILTQDENLPQHLKDLVENITTEKIVDLKKQREELNKALNEAKLERIQEYKKKKEAEEAEAQAQAQAEAEAQEAREKLAETEKKEIEPEPKNLGETLNALENNEEKFNRFKQILGERAYWWDKDKEGKRKKQYIALKDVRKVGEGWEATLVIFNEDGKKVEEKKNKKVTNWTYRLWRKPTNKELGNELPKKDGEEKLISYRTREGEFISAKVKKEDEKYQITKDGEVIESGVSIDQLLRCENKNKVAYCLRTEKPVRPEEQEEQDKAEEKRKKIKRLRNLIKEWWGGLKRWFHR